MYNNSHYKNRPHYPASPFHEGYSVGMERGKGAIPRFYWWNEDRARYSSVMRKRERDFPSPSPIPTSEQISFEGHDFSFQGLPSVPSSVCRSRSRMSPRMRRFILFTIHARALFSARCSSS